MKDEKQSLKRCLVLQSFAPLFLLLTIKYLDISLYIRLIQKFVIVFQKTGMRVLSVVVKHSSFGSFIISIISIIWLILAVIIALGFKGIQEASFQSSGEKIIINDLPNDGGATFLVTYVLPLLIDDVDSIRGLIVFLTMLIMVILLLTRSNIFYQNPVLTAMKYRIFSFEFINPSDDISNPKGTYIGITYKTLIDEKKIIKRKYISDGVFLIYNND